MNIITTLVIAKNLLQQVVRDRFLYILVFYAVILTLTNRVIFEFAAATQDKIFLDAGLGIMNIIGLIVAVFIGTSMMNQEIEKRTILTILAKPITRGQLIISKYLGLCGVLLLLLTCMTIIYLGFLQFQKITHNPYTIILAVIFLFLQLSLITTIAITLGVFTNTLLATLLSIAIYLIGNTTTDLVNLAPAGEPPLIVNIITILYLILPDLSRLDLKNDAVYGWEAIPDTITLLSNAGYGLTYSFILLAIAIFIFSRKEF
ncbi:ABC-2 type transporter [Raphidiopsis curvata NIES-932]|nr:ABC-2 type transporter [Raphidiopsis curvata NIES-932]